MTPTRDGPVDTRRAAPLPRCRTETNCLPRKVLNLPTKMLSLVGGRRCRPTVESKKRMSSPTPEPTSRRRPSWRPKTWCRRSICEARRGGKKPTRHKNNNHLILTLFFFTLRCFHLRSRSRTDGWLISRDVTWNTSTKKANFSPNLKFRDTFKKAKSLKKYSQF